MRYQKIESKIWHDEKFIGLSSSQQRLFFYILTSPHNNLTGLYVLKNGYACEDLRCNVKDFQKDLRKLLEMGFIKYDSETSVIWVKNFLKHNPLTNPNQKKAAKKIICDLPKTFLIQEFIIFNKELAEGLPEGLTEGLSKPETETETETETEKLIKVKEKNNKKTYGEFENVKLTDEEYQKLGEQFGLDGRKSRIKNISQYLASKGDKYKSHYATLLSWERKNESYQGHSTTTATGGVRPTPGKYDNTAVRFDEDTDD